MATGQLISGIRSYTSAVKHMPYSNSMFAKALADTSKFRFGLFGEYTEVREFIGETAGNYSSTDGFNAKFIPTNVWNAHKAEIDREISFSIDYIDELNSILNGMTMTGTEKLKASWRRLGPEIDAVSSATLWNKMNNGNKHANTEVGYKTDVENIIQTIIDKDNELYDIGWYGDVALMMSSDVATTLSNALLKYGGLASGAMLRPIEASTVNRVVEYRGQDYDKADLSFNYEVLRFQSRMYIYKVPRQCMISDVILLDKKSPGQTAGGWLADTSVANFKNIDMFILPVDAAALSVRHVVSNMTIPMNAYKQDTFNINNELDAMNKMYDGQVMVENIGIDQTGDRFKYMNRIKYGMVTFGVLAHTITAIYKDNAGGGGATVTSFDVNVDEVGSDGGSVYVQAGGNGLVDVTAGVFTSNGATPAVYTLVGEPVKLIGTDKLKVGLVTIPKNTTENDITYNVLYSLDNGVNWVDEDNITVTCKTALSGAPTVSSVTTNVSTLTHVGGDVLVNVAGSNLVDVKIKAFTSDGEPTPTYTPVGETVTLFGDFNNQVGILGLPANTGEDDINYVIRVTLDNGSTWDLETATVKVSKED